MRILVGIAHGASPDSYAYQHALWGSLGDEVRIFSNLGHDALYTPQTDFKTILETLSGFRPDVVILYSPEYWPIPRGLELFDGLVVALIGDWNLWNDCLYR